MMCVCIEEVIGNDTNDDDDDDHDDDDDQKSGDADSNGRPGSSALLTSLD